MTSPRAILDREVYSEPEAARLLELPPSTLRYWLQGGERNGIKYAPVIRPDPVYRRWVTWAEFIEAGWLSVYRRQKRVPMPELRIFIERLREEMGVPYPLAHRQPFVSGKNLVYAAQQESKLDPEYRLVDDQMMLTYPGQSFVERVVWSGDIVTGWRPDENPKSRVRVQPDIRFGRPAVSGVSTLTIFEQSEAGASKDELAQDFDLSVQDVLWALSFENARHAA